MPDGPDYAPNAGMIEQKPEMELPTSVPEPSRLKATETLLAAALAGVLTAFGELGILWARRLQGAAVIDLSPLATWMTPLGSMVAFVAVGLLLVILGLPFRILRRTNVVTFVFALLACSSVFTLIPTLPATASILLAAGVAYLIALWTGRNSKAAMRWAATGAAWLVPLAVAVGVGGDLLSRVREARVIAGLVEPAEDAPNVLLLVLGAVRGESLSVYGYERETTPALSALAEESVVFDRAIAPAPWASPSQASILTGLWPHDLSADWAGPLDETVPVLAGALTDRGYATAGFLANLAYTHRGWGFARGFSRYEDHALSVGQIVHSIQMGRVVSGLPPIRRAIGYHDVLVRKSAAELNGDLLQWVDGLDAGRPFFAFVSYFDAHEPLFPPAPYDTMFGPAGVVGPFRYGALRVRPSDRHAWSGQRIQAERDAYDGAIAYLDRSVGELLEALEGRGLLENTLVIITSDHGVQFGEHGLFAWGNSVYTQVTRVPLLLRLPGTVPARARVGQTVSVADIPATVMDIIAPDTALFPGSSLRRLWRRGGGRTSDPVIAEYTAGFPEAGQEPFAPVDIRSVFIERWHYVLNVNGAEELYDVAADPREERNLASEPDHADRLVAMRAALESEMETPGR